MKTKFSWRSFASSILSLSVVAAMVLTFSACSGNDSKNSSSTSSSSSSSSQASSSKTENSSSSQDQSEAEDSSSEAGDVKELGEGEKSFTFEVVNKDGETTTYNIHTDEETVGAALQALELIEGEEGEFGLYVKTVDGITADFDTDGVYWAFYVDGEYATAGVDVTEIVEGSTYSFKVE